MAALDFEQRVIKAIQAGDLKELIHCCIGKNDVNRHICITEEVPIKSKSKQCPFQSIRSPTPLIYTILCEQDELLKYLLEVKIPNLSVRVNGWAPIHYAACTYSHKCLELLLKYEYIQQNIDMPIEEPVGIHIAKDHATTALHIAATNRRHANALLLTLELPKFEYDCNGKKIDPNNATNSSINHNENDDDDDDNDNTDLNVEYQSANALQKSAYGNTPLHIAARQRDWDMCQILLHASDDSTVKNDANKTPADVARENKYDDIAQKLELAQIEPIEKLKDRYLSEEKPNKKKKKSKHDSKPIEKTNSNDRNGKNTNTKNFTQNNVKPDNKNDDSDSDSYSESNENESQELRKEIKQLRNSVKTLTHIVSQLSARVALLEAQKPDADVIQPFKPPVSILQTSQCHICGNQIARQCSQCKFYYCNSCWSKPAHKCTSGV